MLARRIRKIVANRRDSGASAVEYGLLVAGIAAVIVVIVFTLGRTLNTTFTNVNTSINNGGTAATN